MYVPDRTRDTLDLDNPFPAPEHQTVTSPLVEVDAIDFREPIPVGIDPDGRRATLPLAGSSLLIAGSVRSGISSAARHTAAAAVLDPAVELAVFDSMDLGDWDLLDPLATWSAQGTAPRAVPAVLREALDEMLDDLGERSRFLYETAQATPGLHRPDWTTCDGFADRFAPRLIVLAEAEHFLDDPRHGTAIGRALSEVARRGPRTGYALVLTTHQPNRLIHAAGGLREALRHRLALRLPDRYRSDAALGTTSPRTGLDACDLPNQPGTGILLTDAIPRLVRGYYLTDTELAGICQRAAAARGLGDLAAR